VIAGLLAGLESADPARATFLAIWHDSQETRVGDIPYLGRRCRLRATSRSPGTRPPGCPPHSPISSASWVHDYENGDSLEVQCAHDADKLDCLLQAIEYRDRGHQNVAGWIASSRTGLRTKAAEQLADTAVAMTSQDWHDAAMSKPG
jgi:putative hydrolase of HD superfamily